PMRRSFLFLMIAVVMTLPARADDRKPDYPPARKDDVVEKLHSVAVADPYRWLEDGASRDVQEWVAKENAFTRSVLDKVPGRAKIHDRLGTLLEIGSLGTPVPRRGRLFNTARQGKENQPILYVRDRQGGPRRALLDPNKLAAD